jgi:hypothetical protein
MAGPREPRGPRSFDPVVVGNRECNAWAAYYRRDWRHFLGAAIGMVDAGFGMNARRTLVGAWLVLRANQVWAPYPDNDPDRARDYMRRFYRLVAADGRLELDPVEAARLEVEWWRVHRIHQRESDLTESDLTDALVALYSYVYRSDPELFRPAAYLRVAAMRLSDEWVAAGCHLESELLAEQRRALVASYSALRNGIDRAG